MVEKKEGATMTCKNCGTDLICRKKEYGGNFAPTLQWQNFDGSAHYKTSDGKNFTCNVPEDSVESPPDETVSRQDFSTLAKFDERLLGLEEKTERIFEMTHAIFSHIVDEQLRKK